MLNTKIIKDYITGMKREDLPFRNNLQYHFGFVLFSGAVADTGLGIINTVTDKTGAPTSATATIYLKNADNSNKIAPVTTPVIQFGESYTVSIGSLIGAGDWTGIVIVNFNAIDINFNTVESTLGLYSFCFYSGLVGGLTNGVNPFDARNRIGDFPNIQTFPVINALGFDHLLFIVNEDYDLGVNIGGHQTLSGRSAIRNQLQSDINWGSTGSSPSGWWQLGGTSGVVSGSPDLNNCLWVQVTASSDTGIFQYGSGQTMTGWWTDFRLKCKNPIGIIQALLLPTGAISVDPIPRETL